ncbi:hypothetical protein CLI76_06935 [Porphyromonas gingivalis]|nr:hypothetical protein CLI76_06935 [Porphyromonas gingivalis]
MIFDLITGKTAFRQALNLAPKKVFNNEEKFGMVLNKRLKGRGETAEKRSEDSEKRLGNDLYIERIRFIYLSFSIYI